jgi:ERCC4-type nuclease
MSIHGDRLSVIIDTREQAPWAFDPTYIDARIGTLKTGDYALDGDNLFAIERKSLDDFLGTISTGWKRFSRELHRMEGWIAKVIIVEGNYATCTFRDSDGKLIPPAHRHWMLTPQFIEKRIAELTMQSVSVLFATDADLAAGLATAILIQRNHQLHEHQDRSITNPKFQAGNSSRGIVRT